MGNLPVETTRLVDRRAELAWVHESCEASRLVMLTGVGGVGKTRLARRAAAELQPGFRDGAWWVELSPLREGALLAHTIAEALPLADQTTRPMIDVLADYLADRELLLVLDTCEHLTDACALAAEALLRAAPGLRILASSRRPLDVIGEQVLTVEPLPVPPVDGATTASTEETAAVVLLAERAAEAVPGFVVTDANRADVVRVCQRLEGLPLALELAAARLRDLPVAELAARLEDRYAVLGGTDGALPDAAPPWHQALRTAVGWSHELCSPTERLLWARLSVFAGTFDAETARQVCADWHLPGQKIPTLLGALADKSILTWQPSGGGERYRMLDTLREYGAHWLRRLGEEDVLRRRHLDHYLTLAREGEAAWMGPDQFAWYDRMIAEHDNLRTALEFSLDRPEGHTALELGGALWFFWYGCGFPKKGRHYLDRALAADTAPGRARTKALWASGLAAVALGDAEAAGARGRECLAAAEQQGDDDAVRSALVICAGAAGLGGDVAGIVAATDRILAMTRDDAALTLPTHFALVGRSLAWIFAGKPEEALPLLEQHRALCDRYGEQWGRASSYRFRAQAELALGRPEAAQRSAREALRVKHRMRDRMGTGMALDAFAVATGAAGQAESAARLLGLAQRVWETLGVPQMGVPQFVADRQACERQARDTLGDDAYTTAFRTGYDTDTDTAIAHALIHEPGTITAPPPPTA